MLAVLAAALLHASWNAVVKSSPDKTLDIALVSGSSALLAALALPFLPAPAAASLPYMATSATIHLGYFALVGAAYRAGDMSYVYPMMRGLPPLLLALASGPMIGERLSAAGWGGVGCIGFGILGLALGVARRGPVRIGAPTAFALANAVVIAVYSVVDGLGARASGAPVAYTMWVFVLSAVPIAAWTFVGRPAPAAGLVAARLPRAAFGGLCSLVAYAIVLWAMTEAPVALVAALRETSIVFATAISALVLRERVGWSRHAAAGVIMAGAALLKLG